MEVALFKWSVVFMKNAQLGAALFSDADSSSDYIALNGRING
jgi:hypothetical protein